MTDVNVDRGYEAVQSVPIPRVSAKAIREEGCYINESSRDESLTAILKRLNAAFAKSPSEPTLGYGE